MLKQRAVGVLHAFATVIRSLGAPGQQRNGPTRPIDYKGWRITPVSSLSSGNGWSPQVRIAAIDAGQDAEKQFAPAAPRFFATRADADGYAANMGVALVDTALGGWRIPAPASEDTPASGSPDAPTAMEHGSLVQRVLGALGHGCRQGRATPLRQTIVDRLDAGALPAAPPFETRTGYGRGGDLCSACDEPILPAQTEYELEDDTGAITFRFHPVCHGLWEVARQRWKPQAPGARRRLA
jgi:hypothetical protein